MLLPWKYSYHISCSLIAEDNRQFQTSQVIVMPISKQPCFTYDNSTVKILRQQRKCLSKICRCCFNNIDKNVTCRRINISSL